MSGAVLGNDLYNALLDSTLKSKLDEKSKAEMKQKMIAIGNCIVNHIVSNSNITVNPGQSVVGSGGGVPGPMAGSTVSPGTAKIV